MDALGSLLATDNFMPHGHCYLWRPGILWAQVLSNAFIGLAYFLITAGLIYLVRKGQYLPFKGMALAFGLFIVTCGITHFMDVYIIWQPVYYVDSAIRTVTAIASMGTALLLPPLIPKAVALAKGARLAHERGVELESAVNDLGRLYEKSRQLDELKTQFFANVSHELRTPLALILGPLEKLRGADNLDADQRRSVDLALRNADMLLKQVNDLLDVARLEAAAMTARYARIDLAALLRTQASSFAGLALERGLAFEMDAPASLPAELDPEKTQRIILNLLSNAFKFTPLPGSIQVRLTQPSPDQALLEVADSGPGIPPRDRALVFERFRQLDGGQTRRQGGTGLGLTIVKEFAELQGGGVSIDTAALGGALFRVTLPLRAPAGSSLEPASEPAPGLLETTQQSLAELRAPQGAQAASVAGADSDTPAEAEETSARPLVLVVEDNADMNAFIREVLTERYRVARAFNGRQGLDKATTLRPDLLVTDLMMPEMSGDQLLAALRAQRRFDKLPVLLLSAKADDSLRVRLLSEGAQDYLIKPFRPAELQARAANLVTMKRVRDILERELGAQADNLELLAADLTQRKRDLAAALESMRVAREQAERANRLKTDFLGLVSHELRTPLAAIKIQVEQLRVGEEDLSPRGHSLLSRLEQSADRLHGLVDALLQRTRLQAGLSLTPARVDGSALAADLNAEFAPAARAKGLEFRLEVASGLPALRSDPLLLRLTLRSLLDNALRYTRSGSVRLCVRAEGALLLFAVEDSGPGIPESVRQQLFEPFRTGEALRRKHHAGLGLGLALVHDLIGGLGGTLTVESKLGQGSRFLLRLPSLPESSPDAGREEG